MDTLNDDLKGRLLSTQNLEDQFEIAFLHNDFLESYSKNIASVDYWENKILTDYRYQINCNSIIKLERYYHILTIFGSNSVDKSLLYSHLLIYLSEVFELLELMSKREKDWRFESIINRLTNYLCKLGKLNLLPKLIEKFPTSERIIYEYCNRKLHNIIDIKEFETQLEKFLKFLPNFRNFGYGGYYNAESFERHVIYLEHGFELQDFDGNSIQCPDALLYRRFVDILGDNLMYELSNVEFIEWYKNPAAVSYFKDYDNINTVFDLCQYFLMLKHNKIIINYNKFWTMNYHIDAIAMIGENCKEYPNSMDDLFTFLEKVVDEETSKYILKELVAYLEIKDEIISFNDLLTII